MTCRDPVVSQCYMAGGTGVDAAVSARAALPLAVPRTERDEEPRQKRLGIGGCLVLTCPWTVSVRAPMPVEALRPSCRHACCTCVLYMYTVLQMINHVFWLTCRSACVDGRSRVLRTSQK